MKEAQLSQLMLDQSKDLIWIVNKEYQLVYANKTYFSFMKGLSAKGKKLNDTVFIEELGKDDIKKWKTHYSRAFKGDCFEVEEQFSSLGSSEINYSQITFEPIYGDDLEVIAVSCQSRDFTRIVQKREALNHLMDASLDVFCTINGDGNFVHVSGASKILWGYTPEELIGKPYIDFTLEEDVIKTRQSEESLFNGQDDTTFTNRYKKKDGSIAYNFWSAKWDEASKLHICVARDGKLKLEQEQKIIQSEERFKALVQEGADLIGILDASGNFSYISPTCISILGIESTEFLGRRLNEFIHPDDLESVHLSFQKISDSKKMMIEPFRIQNSKKEWRWIETVLSNMLINPAVNGIISNSRDVTDRINQKEKILQSELRFKALIQGGADVMGIIDAEGNYIYVSPASTEIIGMAPEEFIGRNALEFMHPDDVESSLISLQRIATEKRVELKPFRFLNKKNETRWIETVLTNMMDNPVVNGIVANSRDVTDRIEAEERNNLIHNRFESLVENSMDCIVIISPEGKTTYVSGSVKKILGYSVEEVMDLNIWEMCHPDDLEESLAVMSRSIEQPGVSIPGYISRIKHKDGSWRWIEPVITNLIDDPSIKGFVDNFRDITDKVEEQQKLKLLESVITNTKDAVLIGAAQSQEDLDPKIIYVNEAFTKMTGYTAEEVIGKSPRILQGPKSNKEELVKLGHALSNWEPCDLTFISYKKNGEEFWVNLSLTPVANEKDVYTHWVSIERDVTIQKVEELEQDLVTKISDIFHQSNGPGLTECMTGVCECLAEFGQFDFAEIWLPAVDTKTINRVAKHLQGKIGTDFYNASKDISSCEIGEGIPGYVLENKSTVVWGGGEGKCLAKRNAAAKKAGIEAIMGVPLKHKDEVIGVLILGTKKDKSSLALYNEVLKKIKGTIGAELSRKKIEIELAQIFNFTPDMICVAGFDGYIQRINPAGLEILGYSLEELRSRPISSFIHEQDRRLTRENQRKLYRGENLRNFENRYITKEGKIVWLSWTSTSSPEHGVVYAVAKNITEEKNLRELNRHAGRLAKIGSWEFDLINRSIFWSDEVHQLHETDPKSYVPNLEDAINFVRSDFREIVQSDINKCISSGEPFDHEIVLVTNEKKELWIRVIGNVEFVNGERKRIYGSIQDIDERKQAEVRLQSFANNLPGVVFQYIIYPDGTDSLEYVTKGAQKIWGFSSEEVVENNRLVWDNIIAGGELDKVKESISNAVVSKTKWTTRFKYVMPSGELRTHLGNGTPVFLANGTILFNSIILDVTDEVEIEQLLLQASHLAKIGSWELNLLKGQDQDTMYWSPMIKEIIEVNKNYNSTLKKGLDYFIGESRELMKQVLTNLMNEGIEFDEELLLLTAKGKERWVRVIGKSETANNKRTKIYGSLQDIHERKIVALELEKSLKTLKDYEFSLDQSAIVAFTDHKGVITYVNDNFCEISKYDRSEIIGKTHRLINSKYHPKEFFKDLWETITSGKVWRGEVKNKTKDGSYYWVDTTIVPFLDENNMPIQFLAIRFDITSRKAAQEEKNSLMATIENSLNEIYIFDSETLLFNYVNNGALINLGYSEQEIKLLTPIDLKSGLSEADFRQLSDPLILKEKEKVVFMADHERKDGSAYPVEVHLQLVTDGGDAKFLAVVLDITERLEAEQNILKANERFERVTEATNDAIWDWDIVNHSFYRSKAIENFFGKDVLKHMKVKDFWKDSFHSEDLARVQNSLDEAISNPSIYRWESEYRILNDCGEIVYVIDRGIIVRNEDGKAIRMVGAMTDITEQKQFELQLSELNITLQQHSSDLERSNEELEQFAFIASHDLQEPLRMISSFMDLLKSKYEDNLDEKALKYIHFATDGAKRMKQIILDLLDFSRAGKLNEELVSIDLNQILEEYKMLRRKIIEEKNVSILSDELPIIKSFKAPLVQTIHCLLDNAIKYSKLDVTPQIEIRISENEVEWIVQVKDNGIGIDNYFFDKIFIIFQRLHDKDQYGGTGIGLSIAKKNIESCNGRIWVKSIVNEGSEFYFTINK